MSEVIEIVMILIMVTLCFIMVPLYIAPNSVYDAKRKFEIFVKIYDKPYKYNDYEYDRRFYVFKKSLSKINYLNSLNKENGSAVYGITEYADMTDSEFIQMKLEEALGKYAGDVAASSLDKFVIDTDSQELMNDIINSRAKRQLKFDNNLPDYVDWRDKKIVTPVRNQGMCGACWALSVLDTISSVLSIQSNNTPPLDFSVQQMIDCAKNGNNGCKGGNTCALLYWLKEEGIHIHTTQQYPRITDKENTTCVTEINDNINPVIVKQYTCEKLVGNENQILKYLAYKGPVVAAVNAISWQYYLGGIIQHNCDGEMENLNHAVQIVGYNKSGAIPYYIIKNSWSTHFGDEGYIKVEIGSNMCGIADQISVIQMF